MVAAVLAAEAVLAGAVGTVERWPGLVAAVRRLLAGAYGCLAGWLEWDAGLLVGVTAVVGGAAGGGGDGAELLAGGPGAGRPVAVAAARPGAGGGGDGGGGGGRGLRVGSGAVGAGRGVRRRGLLPRGQRRAGCRRRLGPRWIVGRVRRQPPCSWPWRPWARPAGRPACGCKVPRPWPWWRRSGTAWRGPSIRGALRRRVFAGLVAPGAAIAAAWMHRALPTATPPAAVAFGGADLMAVGLLRRRLPLVEGGLIAWLGRRPHRLQRAPRLHQPPTVVPVAVALLVVVEVERGRRRREGTGAEQPGAALARVGADAGPAWRCAWPTPPGASGSWACSPPKAWR